MEATVFNLGQCCIHDEMDNLEARGSLWYPAQWWPIKWMSCLQSTLLWHSISYHMGSSACFFLNASARFGGCFWWVPEVRTPFFRLGAALDSHFQPASHRAVLLSRHSSPPPTYLTLTCGISYSDRMQIQERHRECVCREEKRGRDRSAVAFLERERERERERDIYPCPLLLLSPPSSLSSWSPSRRRQRGIFNPGCRCREQGCRVKETPVVSREVVERSDYFWRNAFERVCSRTLREVTFEFRES